MSVADYVGMAQAGAITVAFLYITISVPGMFKTWLDSKAAEQLFDANEAQKIRDFQERERGADRTTRHELANTSMRMFADMNSRQESVNKELIETITEMRIAMDKFCKFQVCSQGREG